MSEKRVRKLLLLGVFTLPALALAACSSASPVTQSSAPPSGVRSSVAVSSSAAAAPSSSATAPGSPAAPASPTGTASPAAVAAISVTVPAWCTPNVPVTPPGTLAEWLVIYPNYAQFVQSDLVDLLQPFSTTSTENATNRSLCLDIAYAKDAPPPVDVAGYTTVLRDAIKGSIVLNNGAAALNQGMGDPPALAAARPDLEAAETAMVAFYAAIGHPIG